MTLKETLKKLKKHWFGNEPVDNFDHLNEIERKLGASLPANYKYFLQWFSNGGETDAPLDYVLIFKVEELLDRQRDYEIDDWAPHLLIFGLEGDDIFCFDVSSHKSTADYKVVKVSLCSRDPEEIEVVANNFEDFLYNLVKME